MTRFSPDVDEMFRSFEIDIQFCAERFEHIANIDAELGRLTEPTGMFYLRGVTTWRMMLGERDQIIIDLASLIEAICKELPKQISDGNADALSRDWPNAPADAQLATYEKKWRADAFARLFPKAASGVPAETDIKALADRLYTKEFDPLIKDRSKHRAHKTEMRRAKTPTTVKMLDFVDLRAHIEACVALIADIRCLADNSTWRIPDIKVREGERDAEAIVDLFMFGSFDLFLSQALLVGGVDQDGTRFHWQRRKVLYERLHAQHNAMADTPEKPKPVGFNEVLLPNPRTPQIEGP